MLGRLRRRSSTAYSISEASKVKPRLDGGDDEYQLPPPTLVIVLDSIRYLLIVFISVGIVVGLLGWISSGITVQDGIVDLPGSSENADQKVELYQTLSGFVWAAIGMVIEEYFRVFLEVMMTFFCNLPWYPTDKPARGKSPTKRRIILWFVPIMMYVINIGLSSVFVEHRLEEVERGFADGDLVLTVQIPDEITGEGDNMSILDTVLRTAVRSQVLPFAIDPTSKCSSSGNPDAVTELPSITAIKGTSAAFGFLPQTWNYDALPNAVKPTRTIEFRFGENNETTKEREERLAQFNAATGVTTTTIYEMFVQGLTLFDKTATDSNAWLHYPCTNVDHLEDDIVADRMTSAANDSSGSGSHRRRRLLSNDPLSGGAGGNLLDDAATIDDGSDYTDEFPTVSADDRQWGDFYWGLRMCAGAGTSLSSLSTLTAPGDRTLSNIMGTLVIDAEFDPRRVTPLAGLSVNEATVTIDRFHFSPAIRGTAITLDIPFAPMAEYRLLENKTLCDDHGHYKDSVTERQRFNGDDEAFEQAQREQCDPTYIAYNDPELTCGSANCIFKDQSDVVAIKKQVLMAPYKAHCDATTLRYSHDLHSWFPANCTNTANSSFVYGLGSYVTGDFATRSGGLGPEISNARRHYVLSFLQLDWAFEDLSGRFGAACGVDSGCDGLVWPLTNASGTTAHRDAKTRRAQVLVLGRANLPVTFAARTLKNPLTLVSLNTAKYFYNQNESGYSNGYQYYTWEYLHLGFLNVTRLNFSEGMGGGCSPIVEAYMQQVEVNRYFIQRPLQVMYAAALFYLLQDATVKDVELPANNTLGLVDLTQRYLGTTRLGGDREKKEIRYSIPMVSAASSYLGIAVLLLYLGALLHWPQEPVRREDGEATHFAAHYVRVLIEDDLPDTVHARRLQLPTGDTVAIDDYPVRAIWFRHATDQTKTLKLA